MKINNVWVWDKLDMYYKRCYDYMHYRAELLTINTTHFVKIMAKTATKIDFMSLCKKNVKISFRL